MSTMLPLLAAALLALAVPLFVFAIVPARATARTNITQNPVLAPAASAATASVPSGRSTLRWIAPPRAIERLERALQLANVANEWPLHRVLRLKLIATLVAVGCGALFVASGPVLGRGVAALVLVVLVYLAPDVIVASRAKERQDRIQLELPDALDQVTIAVEAGLGLETAIARAGQFGSGPLAEELTRTIQDMRVGFSRKEAWLSLAARTDVVDLRRFARAIMQADQYGVSVGHVVRTQAKELRGKRRQRAEEKAMKVPVKILFPLMFSILPVLFIVVLGPGVLNLLAVLSNTR
jgi:tight adherence protein C